MQVMCISEGWYCPQLGSKSGYGPKYGEICTVVGQERDFYHLKEYYISPVNGAIDGWDVSEFIPLSDIDEKNIIAERQKERV